MSDRLRVLPWIGGEAKDFPNATTAPLVSPVDERVVADMVDADAAAVDVDWRAGDLMVIDNMLLAHGRRPFTGPRRVLVAMSG